MLPLFKFVRGTCSVHVCNSSFEM